MTTRGDSQRRRQPTDKPMANSSQRMALSANKNKNWRANYLRALNIFTPDLATTTRSRPSGWPGPQASGRQETTSRRRTTASATPAASTAEESTRRNTSNSRGRSSVSASTSARQSSRSSSRSRRGASPSDDKNSSYVFGLRSHLFRARRLAPKSDTMVVDRVSAPIEIPTGTSVTFSPTAIPKERDSLSMRRRGSNDFQSSTDKQPRVQLFSWEEPAVMLGSGGWQLEGGGGSGLSAGLGRPVSRHDGRLRRPYSGIAEECEDTEDEGLTNTEDDDDDIFKMEFDGEASDSYASGNVFRGKRASKAGRVERRGFDDFDDEDDVVQPLSASFVPPHQMVERGCFSLGIRDELKRKPGVR